MAETYGAFRPFNVWPLLHSYLAKQQVGVSCKRCVCANRPRIASHGAQSLVHLDLTVIKSG